MYMKYIEVKRFTLIPLAWIAFACGDDGPFDGAMTGGGLDLLGTFATAGSPCGSHWDGTYNIRALRSPEISSNTQLLVDRTTVSNIAINIVGEMDMAGNVRLSASFSSTDGTIYIHDCFGSLQGGTMTLQCNDEVQEDALGPTVAERDIPMCSVVLQAQ